eukprot:748382-Hanusia_phi.AAC.7
MPMDVVCQGYASKNIKHRCISSISPANNLQVRNLQPIERVRLSEVLLRISRPVAINASETLSCALVQISTIDLMQVPREVYLVAEGLEKHPVLVMNDTEKMICGDVERSSWRKIVFSLVELEAIKGGALVEHWSSHKVGENHEMKTEGVERCERKKTTRARSTSSIPFSARTTAWVTIIFSEDYIYGALTLVRALRMEDRDVVVLLANHIYKLFELRNLLQHYGDVGDCDGGGGVDDDQ